jgi:hypothetical protein
MDLPAIEAMTYFTAIFWLGGFAVGLIIKLILPQTTEALDRRRVIRRRGWTEPPTAQGGAV